MRAPVLRIAGCRCLAMAASIIVPAIVFAQARSAPAFRTIVLDTLEGGDLAKPTDVYRLSDGRYMVVDESEKNIKLYDAAGRFVSAIGEPGSGPGQYLSLASGGIQASSVFGFDRATNSVKYFDGKGRYVSATSVGGENSPQPYRVTAVDGDMLLECGFAAGATGRDLITLRRPNGELISTALQLPKSTPAQVAQQTVTLCDSRNGLIYGGLSGADSIHVFDTKGKLLASAPVLVDGRVVNSIARLVAGNDGRIRRQDGTWVHDGMQLGIRLTALPANRVALQLVRFDAQNGSEVLEGGQLALYEWRGNRLRHIETRAMTAGLFNSTPRGAYMLRWIGTDGGRVELSELIANR